LAEANVPSVGVPDNAVPVIPVNPRLNGALTPPAVVTLIGPVVAPAGTVAWIAVFDVTAKVAAVPLNVTVVAPLKLVPLIVTLAPTNPLVGVKLVIVGGLNTVKLLALVAVPPDVVTLNGPVVAPAGTEA